MKCPFDREEIADDAIVCPHCGAEKRERSMATRIWLIILTPLVLTPIFFAPFVYGLFWLVYIGISEGFSYYGNGPSFWPWFGLFNLILDYFIILAIIKGPRVEWVRVSRV